MTETTHHIRFGQREISYKLIRRPRKTLEIAVEPDTTVVVVAPLEASLEAIETRLRKRASWIIRQQRHFSQFLPRTPKRRYLSGETHLYLGRRYRLKVIPHDKQFLKLSRGIMLVGTPHHRRSEAIRKLLENWYRERAHIKFPERVERCLGFFPDAEAFCPADLIIREMKKRWGSLSPSGRLVLNLQLIKAPVDAIDYVIIHELCHKTAPHHDATFYGLLKRIMPDWERRKQRLEQALA